MNRASVRLLRRLCPESAARTRYRVRQAAFIRGILWQGSHALECVDGLAGSVRAYYENEEFINLTKREEVELCDSIKGMPFFINFPALLEKLRVVDIIPTRLSLH